MRRAIKMISPPTFKGEPGERPEAHFLRALDWFDAIGIVTDKEMLRNFRHMLDGNAREWFADLWDKEKRTLTWDDLTNSFSQYFSTQGRSLTHLHHAWKSFNFEVITFCKDAYAISPAERAKKAAQANTTGTGANPFSSIKSKGSSDLVQHLNKLTKTLSKIDFKQRPYKSQIYPRGRGCSHGGRGQPWG